MSTLSLHRSFGYILKFLYFGCQWKELPIEKDDSGRPDIHYTGIYSVFQRNAIFVGSVLKLDQNDLLNTSVIHDDGTTISAKMWR